MNNKQFNIKKQVGNYCCYLFGGMAWEKNSGWENI